MLPAVHQRLYGFNGAHDHGGQLDRLPTQLDLAAHQARDIEQIVHQANQMVDLPLHDAVRLLHGFRVNVRQRQDFERVANRRQGISQLVGQHRKKLVLAAVVFLGDAAGRRFFDKPGGVFLGALSLRHIAGDFGKTPQLAGFIV